MHRILCDRRPPEAIRDRIGTRGISIVMPQMQLHWLGQVERMGNENWVGKCSLEINSAERPERPSKIWWNQVVQCDLLAL